MENLQLLMNNMKVDTKKELWEEAPEWANYVVGVRNGRVGFASNLGRTEMLWMFDPQYGWDNIRLDDQSTWNMGDVLSQRRMEIDFSEEIQGEEVCQCLTGEILDTMDVLNDAGHSQVIAEEFKSHLSLLLEMQRNRLMEK